MNDTPHDAPGAQADPDHPDHSNSQRPPDLDSRIAIAAQREILQQRLDPFGARRWQGFEYDF